MDDLTSKISSTGALPCFCQGKSEQGNSNDELYSFQYNNETLSEPICKSQMKFSSMFGFYMLLNYSLSGIIVIQSLLARTGFIELTKLIKYTSES